MGYIQCDRDFILELIVTILGIRIQVYSPVKANWAIIFNVETF